MPWLAQHEGGHPHHVDEGSQLEAAYRRLGYVEVPAPGSDDTDADDGDQDGEKRDPLTVGPGETFGE
jgi:hypothetical protein